MASPTRSDVHVNRPLGSIAVAVIQEANDYIADKVFPNIPVQKQADRYFVYTRDYWFRTGAQMRAPATESAGSGFHIDNSPSYFCDRWAFHMDVDDDTRQNADDPIDLDRDATEFVMQNLLIRREKLFNSRYMVPGTWTGWQYTDTNGVLQSGDFTPSKLWSDDTSNPLSDVAAMKVGLKRRTSLSPNTMVVTFDLNERLKQHPIVKDQIKYTQFAEVTEEILARLFGVQKYLVAAAVENTAQEGQTGAFDFMTADSMLLVYAAPAPGILKPSAGYIFSWEGQFGGSEYGSRIKTMRMEHLSADRVEGEMAFDMHQVASDLGVFATNLLTAA